MSATGASIEGGGDLVWGVHDSFVGYVRAVEGRIDVEAPAALTADGRFRFPLVGIADGVASFAGGVRFSAHGGALSLALEEIRIATAPNSGLATLSVKGTAATNSEGGRLTFAHLLPDGGAALSQDATVAFDFRYEAGTSLAPIEHR